MAKTESTGAGLHLRDRNNIPYQWPIGIDQAAEYCGLTVAALKYHLYVAKDLQGRLIGHSYIFEKEQLDAFLANKRAPGRPAKIPEPQPETKQRRPRRSSVADLQPA